MSNADQCASDWEYEYDDHETEDVYVLLDLSNTARRNLNSSAQVQAVSGDLKDEQQFYDRPTPKRRRSSSGKTRRRRRRRRGSGSETGEASHPRAATREEPPDDSDEDLVQEASHESNEDELPQNEQQETSIVNFDDIEELEILELHGDNPVVKCNGIVYSCHWAQDIGTNLFFAEKQRPEDGGHAEGDTTDAAPNASPVTTGSRIRSLHGHDLVGVGSIKLVAIPAELKPKELQQQHDGDVPFKIYLPAEASDNKRRQANFLEQLMAIKVRKGERDQVTIRDQAIDQNYISLLGHPYVVPEDAFPGDPLE